MLASGDVVRVRRVGTADEWCVCRVELVSKNGESLALRVLNGGLRAKGGLMMGGMAVLIEGGRAYEVFTDTELEMELSVGGLGTVPTVQ
jgi:hypothetical protein